jgi:hypothetical protein
MKKKHAFWVALSALGLGITAAVGASMLETESADAADHLDPPARTDPGMGADRTADIGDIYAWHRGTGASATVVTVLTFDGPNDPAADQAIACDRDVLYTIHIDNDDDNVTDFDIEARFGEDDLGNCFVEVSDIPGETDAIEAPVGYTRQGTDAMVYAGLHDDPFFFDLMGFQNVLASGDLGDFVNDRDFFAGKNISALVLEFPLPAAAGGGTSLRVWASTARFGG